MGLTNIIAAMLLSGLNPGNDKHLNLPQIANMIQAAEQGTYVVYNQSSKKDNGDSGSIAYAPTYTAQDGKAFAPAGIVNVTDIGKNYPQRLGGRNVHAPLGAVGSAPAEINNINDDGVKGLKPLNFELAGDITNKDADADGAGDAQESPAEMALKLLKGDLKEKESQPGVERKNNPDADRGAEELGLREKQTEEVKTTGLTYQSIAGILDPKTPSTFYVDLDAGKMYQFITAGAEFRPQLGPVLIDINIEHVLGSYQFNLAEFEALRDEAGNKIDYVQNDLSGKIAALIGGVQMDDMNVNRGFMLGPVVRYKWSQPSTGKTGVKNEQEGLFGIQNLLNYEGFQNLLEIAYTMGNRKMDASETIEPNSKTQGVKISDILSLHSEHIFHGDKNTNWGQFVNSWLLKANAEFEWKKLDYESVDSSIFVANGKDTAQMTRYGAGIDLLYMANVTDWKDTILAGGITAFAERYDFENGNYLVRAGIGPEVLIRHGRNTVGMRLLYVNQHDKGMQNKTDHSMWFTLFYRVSF